MKAPTDAEILKLAVEPDLEFELERVLAMSPEEVRASLRARGYDLRVLEAEAKALWSRIQPQKQKLGAGYIAGGVAIFGSFATVAATLLAPVANTTLPVLATAAAPAPTLSDVWEDGLRACKEGRWDDCRTNLDAAHKADPDGERRSDVIAARALLKRGKP